MSSSAPKSLQLGGEADAGYRTFPNWSFSEECASALQSCSSPSVRSSIGLLDDPQSAIHLQPLQHFLGQSVVIFAAMAVGGVLVNALPVGGSGLQLRVISDNGLEHQVAKHLL